jgi:hypothetical protein
MSTPHAGQVRYYQEDEKSVAQCASHGDDHGSYGWSRQIDPRWNEYQVTAYNAAYDAAQAAKHSIS